MSTPESTLYVLRQLAEFAGAAEMHAKERHGISLNPNHWDELDLVLTRERTHGDPGELESLALCYGAWIGQVLVATRNAEWISLHEPVPPRIRLQGHLYSPIDAVRRRLTEPAAPAIENLINKIPADTLPDQQQHRDDNRSAWDQLSGDHRFVNPHANASISQEQVKAALDPWLADIPLAGLNVLCLAAGGGTHGPLFAAAGACVTVVDFSPALLAVDEQAARMQNLNLKTVQADLSNLSTLKDEQFDLVMQPVSACYLPDLKLMFAEVARVLQPGGLYLSQQKSPGSLQAGKWSEAIGSYIVQYPVADGSPLVPEVANPLPQRETGMVEYVHSLDSLIGGLCRSGFVIEDFQEPTRGDAWSSPGSVEHRAIFFPPYIKLLARRIDYRTR